MPTLPGSLVAVWAAVLSVLFSPGYYERLYGTEGATTALNIVARTPNGARVSVSGRRRDGGGATRDYFLYNNGSESRLEMAVLVEAKDTLLRLYLMKRREFGFLLELQISNAATLYASTLLPNM